MRIRAWPFLLPAFVLTLPSAAAFGHDHAPPPARVVVGDSSAQLRLWSTIWTKREGPRLCSTVFGDGIPDWEPVLATQAGDDTSVVFRKHRRPATLDVTAARRLRHFSPDDPQPVQYTLRRRRRDDVTVAWIAELELPATRRSFVELTATWPDSEGCGGEQEASWDFRLEPSRPRLHSLP